MQLYGALHPKSDVDRLYIKKKEGGKGMMSLFLSIQAKKILKSRNYTCSIVHYFTRKLEFASNILSVIVALFFFLSTFSEDIKMFYII